MYLLTLSVDEDFGTSAISSDEYSIGIDLRVGPARSMLGSLEQLTYIQHGASLIIPSIRTVFVIPSVNLVNLTSPSSCSHSGNNVNIKRKADV